MMKRLIALSLAVPMVLIGVGCQDAGAPTSPGPNAKANAKPAGVADAPPPPTAVQPGKKKAATAAASVD